MKIYTWNIPKCSYWCVILITWTKDLSPYIDAWLFVSSKVNRIQIGAFSPVYIFRSDRLDTLVLFSSIHWMYEKRHCTVIWNVQEASAARTKLVLYVPFCKCVSPDVRHSSSFAAGSLSVRNSGYYIPMHCHSPVGK